MDRPARPGANHRDHRGERRDSRVGGSGRQHHRHGPENRWTEQRVGSAFRNGSVNLSTTGSVRATTVNGSINATMGRAVWPTGAKFTTVNGEVTLRLPVAVNADARLSTVNGSIQSEFPLAISTDPGPKHAEGVLGGGGQRLDV